MADEELFSGHSFGTAAASTEFHGSSQLGNTVRQWRLIISIVALSVNCEEERRNVDYRALLSYFSCFAGDGLDRVRMVVNGHNLKTLH